MTGKYKSIGSMIVESAMLTTHESKYTDSYTINIYNIEQLPEKNEAIPQANVRSLFVTTSC